MGDSSFNYAALEKTLASLERLRIDPSRLHRTAGSGRIMGGYGNVWFGTLDEGTPHSAPVAVKELRQVGTDDERARIAFRLAREVKIWAQFKHPNLLRLIGFCLDEEMTMASLVSPFVPHGHIAGYLEENKPDGQTRLELLVDTAKGLDYLHGLDPGVCHGDLKARNVLVTDQRRAVLCDFGLASVVESADNPTGLTTTKSFRGTSRHLSPELVTEDVPRRTLSSDIWAWGCLLLEILQDMIPYAHVSGDSGVIRNLVLGTLPADISTLNLSANVESLLTRCWNFQPDLRPTISECCAMLQLDLRSDPGTCPPIDAGNAVPLTRVPSSSPNSVSQSPFTVTTTSTSSEWMTERDEEVAGPSGPPHPISSSARSSRLEGTVSRHKRKRESEPSTVHSSTPSTSSTRQALRRSLQRTATPRSSTTIFSVSKRLKITPRHRRPRGIAPSAAKLVRVKRSPASGDRNADPSSSKRAKVSIRLDEGPPDAMEVDRTNVSEGGGFPELLSADPEPTAPSEQLDVSNDRDDENDPLFVSEYAEEIMQDWREREVRTIPSRQEIEARQGGFDWAMRGVWCDKLVRIHRHFCMVPETLFLAVNLLERFLSKRTVAPEKLLVAGIGTLLIAAKYEEIMHPPVEHIHAAAGCSYDKTVTLQAEAQILKELAWDVSYPGPMLFLRWISRANDFHLPTRTLAKYLIEIYCFDPRLLETRPSLLAASGMWLSLLMLNQGGWTPSFVEYSGYEEDSIVPIAAIMIDYILQPTSISDHEEFHRKYAQRRFSRASTFAHKWVRERWKEGDAADLFGRLPRIRQVAALA